MYGSITIPFNSVLLYNVCKLKEGHCFEESDIKYPIVNTNTDVYRVDEQGKKHLLLKFRK